MDGLVRAITESGNVNSNISFGNRKVGPGERVFIIAEAGVNHNGDLGMASKLVQAAIRAGADAVKFQTFRAECLVTRTAPKAAYQMATTNAAESQYDMLRRLELSPEAHQELMAQCRQEQKLFLSTPFDEESADLLDALGISLFKVASGELTNLPFLTHIARKGKPMIVSTGAATLGEVEEAVETIARAGNRQLILLHCVSNYPAQPSDANLRAMQTMRDAFGVPVGYSDHTMGFEVTLAAVALGACVIEKHLTLDRSLPGPDHRASLEPADLAAMVQAIRSVEAALGDGRKRPASTEAEVAGVARKSLVAASRIPSGTVLTEGHIAIKRPGTGLSPGLRPLLVGRRVAREMEAGELFQWNDLA